MYKWDVLHPIIYIPWIYHGRPYINNISIYPYININVSIGFNSLSSNSYDLDINESQTVHGTMDPITVFVMASFLNCYQINFCRFNELNFLVFLKSEFMRIYYASMAVSDVHVIR
jgi:hypothetical protein